MKYDIDLTYWRNGNHLQNVKKFDALAKEFGLADDMFFPNNQPAPWHVQLRIGENLYNFWPHVLKGHIAYTSHVVQGVSDLKSFFHDILNEDEDDIEVVK